MPSGHKSRKGSRHTLRLSVRRTWKVAVSRRKILPCQVFSCLFTRNKYLHSTPGEELGTQLSALTTTLEAKPLCGFSNLQIPL